MHGNPAQLAELTIRLIFSYRVPQVKPCDVTALVLQLLALELPSCPKTYRSKNDELLILKNFVDQPQLGAVLGTSPLHFTCEGCT